MPTPTLFGGLIRLNVPSFSPASDQYFPTMTGLASGRLFAAWVSDGINEGGIYRADGTTETALRTLTFTTGPASSDHEIDATTLSDGRIAVVWTSQAVDSAGDVNFSVFTETGSVTTQALAVTGEQDQVSVSAGTTGGFVIVHDGPEQSVGNEDDIYRRSFSSSLGVVFGPVPINGSQPSIQENGEITRLANGDQIAVWIDRSDNTIRGRVMLTDGFRPDVSTNPLLTLSTAAPVFPDTGNGNIGLAALAGGGFAISYSSSFGQDTVTYRLFDNAGNPTTGELTVAGLGDFGQAAIGLKDGRLLLVSANDTGPVKGQIIGADGVPEGGVFVIGGSIFSTFHPTAALLADGRVAVSWIQTGLAGGSFFDIAMQIIDPRTAAVDVEGTAEADEYYGSAFDDIITGVAGNDTLYGGAGWDNINGGSGNDSLYGDAGFDILIGGAGDDNFFVDHGNDQAKETAFNGNDRVYASANYALWADQHIETLSTTDNAGTANIHLSGNNLANTVIGNNGNNRLDGRAGIDQLYGLLGNDEFFVDNALDRAYENAGQGNDRVFASVSYSLIDGYEIETLSTTSNVGTTAINLTGNSDANTIYGNNGANFLNGRGGNDLMMGLAGADSFVFDRTPNGATNVDQIVDFSSVDDTIRLDDAIFTGLALGTLAGPAFFAGAGAIQATLGAHRIIQNTTTGDLFFDSDGVGGAAAVRFAFVAANTSMNNTDFVVF
jgi:Ca2+-binding RTX toxin-like protein